MNLIIAIRNCWPHILIAAGYTLLYWTQTQGSMFATIYFYIWLTVMMFILSEANSHNHKRINERKVIRIPINPVRKSRLTTTIKAWSLFIGFLIIFYSWLVTYA